ncbi:hypothetical protein NM208_g8453 [Fusarium decemcellulare]|uniref:Uncharacterized protein n=1 Tax=Fusarium decemcellulare TaxID=57161 RepID=A0ACC1S5C3_9HYPO|nr:hypothetical protein NM208_g8453 [Fusarium decemcellulare]
METKLKTSVLVVGAGPAGLLLAFQLAKHGVKCILVERNTDTTKWPKMTLHNARTMELLRRMGLEDGVRSAGVPTHFNFRSIFHSGFSEGGRYLGAWEAASPDDWKKEYAKSNDGTLPRVPYQRCAQSAFEKWLRPVIERIDNIDLRYDTTFESLEEQDDHVVSYLSEGNGNKLIVTSQYVVGCDGAGSRVRRNIGATLSGGPVPFAYYLVSFVSHDFERLRPEGQNWHIFFTSGGYLIAQNEHDIWTVHKSIALGTDVSKIDPYQVIYDALGGSTGIPYKVDVEEILVTSSWRPAIALVDRYRSQGGRIFLSGDSAHQNIPTGGYGYNTAVGDSTGLGWALAAVINGYGGEHLLQAYEIERRPVAARNLEYSGIHAQTHRKYVNMVLETGPHVILQNSEEGEQLRNRVTKHINTENIENFCYGVELGYRYNGSPVIFPDREEPEPTWTVTDYIPSTWPGSRPPHVWLDGKWGQVSIFDLFGNDFTLVDFTSHGQFIKAFGPVAEKSKIPVKMVHLPYERHVRRLWGRDAVLIRPDDMVAWRAPINGQVPADIAEILAITVGQKPALSIAEAREIQKKLTEFVVTQGFKAVVGGVDLKTTSYKAAFQMET